MLIERLADMYDRLIKSKSGQLTTLITYPVH